MEAIDLVFVILFGLIWGSFLNVVIYRLPAGKSLLRPRSSCPQCGRPIKPYDNIPLLSYLWLGGRCRSCRKRIPLVYPLVELLTAGCLLILYLTFGLTLHFFACGLFASSLIILGFIDFFHQVLPDAITLPGLALALVYSFFREGLKWTQALLGAAVGGGAILLIYGVYYLLRKREGMGLGDVTMMLMVGAFLGWRPAVLTLLLAAFSGALVGLALILAGKKGLQQALPFGSFLAPAAFAALLWGERLMAWYLSLYRR